MKTAAALLGLLVFAQDEIERRIEMLLRGLKDQLKLTDEQTAKIKEVLIQSEKERQEKVKALLTDEQKKTYDEWQQRGSGGREGRDGRGFGGRMFGGFQVEQLKEALGLTDEQFEKIKAVIDQFTADMRKRMEEGGFNWREEMPKLLEELGKKIKEHLTPEQKEKYDKFVEERMRGFGGFGDGGRRRPAVEERAKRVMDALKIADEKERGIVQDLVIRVLKARDASEDFDREYRDKVRDLTRSDLSEEALEARLNELREERKKREKELTGARRELGEVVTLKQELILIEQGVLR